MSRFIRGLVLEKEAMSTGVKILVSLLSPSVPYALDTGLNHEHRDSPRDS